MTPESVTIVLPLPGGLLSPNNTVGSIGGRFAKAKAIKKYRKLTEEAVVQTVIETSPWQKVSVKARFYFKNNRRRDVRNAMGSLKPAEDGIIDAGLVTDDDYEHMEHEKPVFKLDPIDPRVELTITRLR